MDKAKLFKLLVSLILPIGRGSIHYLKKIGYNYG